MSDWYTPDGVLVRQGDVGWGDRKAGGVWDREHLETELEGGMVSTVWLGLDHSWGSGPPLIFESMAFCDGPLDQTCERYATREEARIGHAAMVEKVKAERAAWLEVCADERVRDCARVVAEALRGHAETFAGEVYGLGSEFDALVKALAAEVTA